MWRLRRVVRWGAVVEGPVVEVVGVWYMHLHHPLLPLHLHLGAVGDVVEGGGVVHNGRGGALVGGGWWGLVGVDLNAIHLWVVVG